MTVRPRAPAEIIDVHTMVSQSRHQSNAWHLDHACPIGHEEHLTVPGDRRCRGLLRMWMHVDLRCDQPTRYPCQYCSFQVEHWQ